MKPFDLPFTAFHNYVIDNMMPDLSPNAWKVLCVAIRQTFGWKDESTESGRKEKDRIAYSQFMGMTGIKSSATLSRAIQENLDKGYLLRDPSPEHAQMYDYRLNQDYEVEVKTSLEIKEVRQGTSSEIEEVERDTSLDSKEVMDETSLEIEDTKENLKERSSDKEMKKESVDPLSFDLERKTMAKHRVGSNYAVPVAAGGDASAAEVGLVALYEAKGSEPPRRHSAGYVQQVEKVAQVLKDCGVIDPAVARLASQLFVEDKPGMANPYYGSFPGDYADYLGRAKKQQKGASYGSRQGIRGDRKRRSPDQWRDPVLT